MKLRSSIAAITVLAAALAISTRAADEKAPDASKDKPKSARLTKPWSELPSLNDEQKSQIREIHSKFLADVQALRQKEREDILALLNEDQKKELVKLETAAKAKAKPAAEATEEKKD